MAPHTKGLSRPETTFSTTRLALLVVDPNRLVRISTHVTGEPYFNRSGINRFDDPNPDKAARYGTCYFGFKLCVALAETLLHDRKPVNRHFMIAPERIDASFVLHYRGTQLILANMTGASLKRVGLHGGLSGTSNYTMPQKWSQAIHEHSALVDGFVYMSRHLNTEKAVVLFDRASSKIQLDTATPLQNYSGFGRAAKMLGIKGC